MQTESALRHLLAYLDKNPLICDMSVLSKEDQLAERALKHIMELEAKVLFYKELAEELEANKEAEYIEFCAIREANIDRIEELTAWVDTARGAYRYEARRADTSADIIEELKAEVDNLKAIMAGDGGTTKVDIMQRYGNR